MKQRELKTINWTIFRVTADDSEMIMWLADHYSETDIVHMARRLGAGDTTRKEALESLKGYVSGKGEVYGSYFRPGDYWGEPVYVCPKCVHATLQDGEPEDSWYCKYCYTTWHHSSHGFHFERVAEEAWDDES